MRERITGRVYAKVAAADYDGKKLTGKQLLAVIGAVTKANAVVLTDNFRGYNILNHTETNPAHYTHITVNHSLGQYSAGSGVHTNGIEGFWAVLKRAVVGSYHHVSVRHMQRYVDECCFRQRHRGETAFDALLLQGVVEDTRPAWMPDVL